MTLSSSIVKSFRTFRFIDSSKIFVRKLTISELSRNYNNAYLADIDVIDFSMCSIAGTVQIIKSSCYVIKSMDFLSLLTV